MAKTIPIPIISTRFQEPVGIGDLMLTEVLQGFRSDTVYETAKSLLVDLPICEIIAQERAIKAAENYRFLRKKGITLRKTVDNLIATFCMDQQLALLFVDKDFVPLVKH